MKILWHSNSPLVATGYGCQVAIFAPRFKAAGYDVACSAFYPNGGAQIEWNDITIYPGDDHPGSKFGRHLLRPYIDDFAGGEDCLVLTLMDVWALGPGGLDGLKLASWCPVDHEPIPPKVTGFFRTTGSVPIAMSRFGEREMRDAGLDPFYVPHGVETEIFRPMPERKREIREALGLPPDAFVFGMVANNQGSGPPRKAFPQVLQVFEAFRQSHPDAMLWMHTDMFGKRHGVNLALLAEIVGIPEQAIMATAAERIHLGLPKQQMAQLYNAFDVLVNPSYGEGFGLPIVEAQACGVPVIVTDWTSMPELVGAGWTVDGDPWYDSTQGSFYKCPSLVDLYGKFEEAYAARGDEQMRTAAREFALGYDADRVMVEHWVPVLRELSRPREVPALPNRAARRASARAKAAV